MGRSGVPILLLLLLFSLMQWNLASAQGGISLTITGVEATHNTQLGGYDVTAYLSVVDEERTPILGLSGADFIVSEDGAPVETFELEAVDAGISMVLAIDTSGSMAAQGKMAAVKGAVASFVEGLEEQDEIGLISFNEQPLVEINLTQDRAAVGNFVGLLEPVQGASTCLWDSAYEAVQLAAGAPAGRRAAVLLTDGIDELASGGPCSTKTLEDVVDLASDSAVLVPIYTVGVGNRVNSQELSRLSDLTGGRSSFAANAATVGDVFSELGLQFRGSYAMHYRTDIPSGEHTLFVQVEHHGARDQDTRKFRAPRLAGQAVFSGISEGQLVQGDLDISLKVSGPTAASVEFYLDDDLLSMDSEPPYETRLDVADLAEGSHSLRAVAFGSEREALAVSEISFAFEPPQVAATSEGGPPATQEVSIISEPSTPLALVVGLPSLLVLAAVGGFLALRRSRARAPAARLEQDLTVGHPIQAPPEPTPALAALEIEDCQDPSMVGERFEIRKERVVIGRSSEADIVIPVQPVSRVHAMIILASAREGLALTMDEIDLEQMGGAESSGDPLFQIFDGEPELGKTSTYGTYVNNVKVPPAAAFPLADRAQIRLGRSLAEGRTPPVILKFSDLRRVGKPGIEAELTTDIRLNQTDMREGEGAGGQGEDQIFATEEFHPESPDDLFKTEEFNPDEEV